MTAAAAFQHAAATGSMRFALSLSFFEIYKEQIVDLIGEASLSTPPSIAMTAGGGGAFDVVGVAEVPVSDIGAALRLIARGTLRRSTGSSYKHDASSRSHCLLRLRLASETWDGATRVSQFTLVDLAGAELLMAQASATNTQESKNINLSLLTLKAVISALASGASHVPFRESALTKLLSNALGGNSRTAILCTCSPAAGDAGFTQRTLRFGQVARKVRTRLASPLFTPPPTTLRDEGAVHTQEVALGGAAAAHAAAVMDDIQSDDFSVQCSSISTAAGALTVYHALQGGQGGVPSPGEPTSQVALLLHAYGSNCSGLDMLTLGAALFRAGYSVLMPDLPGFGSGDSGQLKKCSGRTEKMDNAEGPLPAMEDILRVFGVTPRRRAVAYGFDFGGTLCLGLACRPPKKRMVSALSVFHANWTADMSPLNAVKIPVQVLWLTVDQNHPVALGSKLARALPHGSLVKLKAAFFKAGMGGDDAVQAQIVQRTCSVFGPASPAQPAAAAAGAAANPSEGKGGEGGDAPPDSAHSEGKGGDEPPQHPWLCTPPSAAAALSDSGLVSVCDDSPLMRLLLDQSALGLVRGGPTKAAQAAAAAHAQAASGAAVSVDLALFRPQTGEAERSAQWAARVLQQLLARGQLPSLLEAYLTSGSEKPQAVALFAALPPVTPCSPAVDLQACGLWGGDLPLPTPAEVWAHPRFPRGRQVLVRARVCTALDVPEAAFLTPASPADGGVVTVTHKAWVHSLQPAAGTATVYLGQAQEGTTQLVPLGELTALNCATNFRTSARGGVVFEDGVECKYSGLLMRALLCRCALQVQPLLQDIADMWQSVRLGGAAAAAQAAAVAGGRSEEVQRGTAAQAAAVAAIAGAMNCTHIPNDGMQVGRCRLPDVARLAHFGQGHCHTQASVTCALLLAFGAKLGWDVKFRGGSVMPVQGGEGGVLREADQHTWCEVTLLPSCESLVLDATFKEVGVPLQQAYARSGRRHVLWGSACDCTALPAECEVLQ